MHVLPPQEERQREIDLLDNLLDDLTVLEHAWHKKKVAPQKIVSHLIEILESIQAISRAETLEEFEKIAAEIRGKLNLVLNKKAKLEKKQWAMISELIELVKESLREKNAFIEGAAWDEKKPSHTNETGRASEEAPSSENSGERIPPQEENHMDKSLQVNAQELLQKAQEALVSGNGEGAKELAMQAAELLAKIEAEEAKKKEKILRAELEDAAREEAEAEETFARITQEKSDREQEINALSNKLTDARSSFNEQQRACQNIKETVEKIESEISSLNEQRKKLLEQFQEALPARDAAERECNRLKKELDKFTPELELILDSANAAEAQLAKARQKKQTAEAQLESVSSKIAV
jgi:chromosome segregation ATPase